MQALFIIFRYTGYRSPYFFTIKKRERNIMREGTHKTDTQKLKTINLLMTIQVGGFTQNFPVPSSSLP